MIDSLKIRTFKNISYNAFAKVISFSFQAIANIVLARNLVASDYGIVGFALIFINFLYQFSDLGIGSAIVQKSEVNERVLYTGFTIKVVLGIILFFTAFLISPISSFFMDNSAVTNVIKLLSLNFIISSFAFLPITLLTRDINFKKIFISQIGLSTTNSLICIILALSGFKYWSIVIANLGSTILYVILLNIIYPVKVKFLFDNLIAAKLIHFGSNLFFSGIIVFAIFNIDNFVIGTVKGSETLGYYAIAFSWGSMICVILGGIILNVLFPTFSKMQQDIKRIREAYIKVLEYQCFIVMMANVGLLLVSKEFLFFILGHSTGKWLPALIAFRILCFYGIIRAILEPVGSVIMAVGKPRILLIANSIVAVIEVGLLLPALYSFNIAGVAILVTIAYLSQYVILFKFIKHELRISVSELTHSIYPAITSSIIAFAVTFYLKSFLSFSIIGIIEQLSIFLILYCISYGILTKWKMLHEVKILLSSLNLIKMHSEV